MKIFVLWRAVAPTPENAPDGVARRLAAQFRPLLKAPVEVVTRTSGPVHLAWLELPVKGFRAPFLEDDGQDWACAPDYPLNARRLLRQRGIRPDEDGTLLALGKLLETNTAACVRELVPPAALIWSGAEEGVVRVQNDGLGQAQLFEHDDGRTFALTNRVTALRALGIALQPVAAEWAARFTTHWFPLDRSGYRNVRFLAGGTQLRIGREGIERSRHDPIGGWVNPPARKREEALELGRNALLDTLTDALELCERPTVGLSGGWDSRAVAACLRALGADFDLRVRGQETHFDVILSAELARVAGLPHRIKSEGGIPPGTAEGCRASIARALLWQGGYFATKKHKNFLAKEGRDGLDGGVVNVMGQHAGLGKGDFIARTAAAQRSDDRHEERLLALLREEAPPCLHPTVRPEVEALLQSSYRSAERYGLTGLGPLAFFYLHEFTRRWGSATVAGQSGLVLAPFLCPDMIRACYSLPAAELPTKPLHRYITAYHAPDWAEIPYTDEVTEEDFVSGRLPRVKAVEPAPPAPDAPRWRTVRRHKKFHYKFYWSDVGQPLLEEAFERGGFWTEIFDADAARAGWGDSSLLADSLAVAHLLPPVLDGSLPVHVDSVPVESVPD